MLKQRAPAQGAELGRDTCELALTDVGNDRALELTGKVPLQPGLPVTWKICKHSTSGR